jgi:hypothetical protein
VRHASLKIGQRARRFALIGRHVEPRTQGTLGSSFRERDRQQRPAADLVAERHAYAWARGSLAVVGLIGLGAALLLPANLGQEA